MYYICIERTWSLLLTLWKWGYPKLRGYGHGDSRNPLLVAVKGKPKGKPKPFWGSPEEKDTPVLVRG